MDWVLTFTMTDTTLRNATMTWRDNLQSAISALASTMVQYQSATGSAVIKQARRHAAAVLAEHPALRDLLPTSNNWHLYTLTNGSSYNTGQLLSHFVDRLLDVAEKSNIEQAVQTCDQLLTHAAEHKLPGYEFTFFVGLNITERWDIAPGLFAIPYQALPQLLGRDGQRILNLISLNVDTQSTESTTVLVSELRWGPVVVSTKGRTLQSPWPIESILIYNHNPLLLVALLAVALKHPLTLLANTRQAAPWVWDILGIVGNSSSHFPLEGRPDDRIEPSEEMRKIATQTFEDWNALTDTDRNTLALATTRLSASLSRSGFLASQDKVLDISIALEILYGLDHHEITYKLSTRAGWYLGSCPKERLRVRKEISDLYENRSAIVHSGKLKKSDQSKEHEIREKALDIARETLLKHLARGNVPGDSDWPKIVMGAEDSADSQSAI